VLANKEPKKVEEEAQLQSEPPIALALAEPVEHQGAHCSIGREISSCERGRQL
jgi:hypothetical protein